MCSRHIVFDVWQFSALPSLSLRSHWVNELCVHLAPRPLISSLHIYFTRQLAIYFFSKQAIYFVVNSPWKRLVSMSSLSKIIKSVALYIFYKLRRWHRDNGVRVLVCDNEKCSLLPVDTLNIYPSKITKREFRSFQ